MSRRDARRGRTTSVGTMRRSPSQPAGRRPVLDWLLTSVCPTIAAWTAAHDPAVTAGASGSGHWV